MKKKYQLVLGTILFIALSNLLACQHDASTETTAEGDGSSWNASQWNTGKWN